MFGYGSFCVTGLNAGNVGSDAGKPRVVWRIVYVVQAGAGSRPVKKYRDVSNPARIGSAIQRILAATPNVSTFAVQKTQL